MNLQSFLIYLAPLIGVMTLLIGVAAVLSPQKMSVKFGIAADGATLPYVISAGIRDVFMGIAVLVLFYFQAWMPLGLIHLALGIVAISDFAVVRKHGDRKTSLVHILGAIVVVLFGLWLIAQSSGSLTTWWFQSRIVFV